MLIGNPLIGETDPYLDAMIGNPAAAPSTSQERDLDELTADVQRSRLTDGTAGARILLDTGAADHSIELGSFREVVPDQGVPYQPSIWKVSPSSQVALEPHVVRRVRQAKAIVVVGRDAQWNYALPL